MYIHDLCLPQPMYEHVYSSHTHTSSRERMAFKQSYRIQIVNRPALVLASAFEAGCAAAGAGVTVTSTEATAGGETDTGAGVTATG